MSQVQLTITFNIKSTPPPPPPEPLKVSPASMVFPDLTVGTAIPSPVAVASITGGNKPYSISADPNSLPTPPGLAVGLGDDGVTVVVSGTPTVGGSGDVIYNITDADGTTAQFAVSA